MSMLRVLLLLCIFFVGCDNSRKEVVSYIKELDRYPVENISVKKKLLDPSYNYPYSIYIKIKMDSLYSDRLIYDLGLVRSFGEDSAAMKRYLPLDEYESFFTMNSINMERISSFRSADGSVSWWPFDIKPILFLQVYSTAYKDSDGHKRVAQYKESHNGRLALARHKSYIYILIDCWWP
ncbi:MAG: hypothetical protein BGO54_07580 [Sphingobacteriales bacterium 46-32]|nr:MAG: hypothetical protein BGO54_07580 [Sphingobacteriales bacterium 46-32]